MKQLLMAILVMVSVDSAAQKEVAADKWLKLFNGKDLKDWNIKITGYRLNDNFGNTFRVDSGMLKVNYDHYDQFNERYGHIFYKKNFSAYLLVVEYKFTGNQVKGGPEWAYRNSGIMLHGQSAASMTRNQDFPVSLELQLLGGNGKDKRSTANLCTPGTNVVMNGRLITDHCISSTSYTYPGDVWVHVEALVLRDSVIKHIVDRDTVLVYNKPQIGGGNVTHANPALLRAGRILSQGSISLQSESHPVTFRKVMLFDLSPYLQDPIKLNRILHLLQKRTSAPKVEKPKNK